MIVPSNHGFTEPIKSALLFFVLGFTLGAAISFQTGDMWAIAFVWGAVSAYVAGGITWFAWLVHRLFYAKPQPVQEAVVDEPEMPGKVTYQVISKDGLACYRLYGLPISIDEFHAFVINWANGVKLTYKAVVTDIETHTMNEGSYAALVDWFVAKNFGAIPSGYKQTMVLTELGTGMMQAAYNRIEILSPSEN